MAIYVWVDFTPRPGQGEAVAAVLGRMPPLVRAEPGCRRYDLFRTQGEGGEPAFHLHEVYDDEAAIEAHRRYDHYLAYRAEIMPLLSSPPKVALLTAVDAAPP